ncbi:MAG: glycosyltransferase family 4 protein [Planctomycetota bacterium]|jgi:glycosyltransferase involved in cell wall biosynthesis
MTALKTVLYLSQEPECGGAEISLLELLGAVDRARYRPVLITSGEGALARRAREIDVPVHLVAWTSTAGALVRPGRLAAIARKESAALVHANTLRTGYLGLRLRRPLVWHVRDMTYPWLARLACKRAARVIANSKATAATLGVAEKKLRVVYNGVAPAYFAERDRALRSKLDADTVLLGVIGRLDPWKGHADLIEAMAQVGPRARLWVVGDVAFGRHGDYKAELAKKAARLGLADRVEFLGWREDVPEILAALDLLVHPSSEPEPFGRALAEAQASGVAIVATAAGGIPEVVADQVTGLLVPPRDPAALARAIDGLVADPARRAAMGAAGRERARRLFTREAHARAVEAVYEELLPH